MAFFSLVIPTKNRPECVEQCLQSILRSTFQDFEIIVSDNGSQEGICRVVIDKLQDSRIKYYKTPIEYGLCDSFEYAIGYAGGQYVMVLGDKNLLYPDALKKLYDVVIAQEGVDIVNYRADFLEPVNVEKSIIEGKLKKQLRSGETRTVDRYQAIKGHMSCRALMAGHDITWYLGAINNGGMYSKYLIDRLREVHESGRVFDGVVPDRYVAIEVLCIAEKVLFLDDNIIIYDICRKNTWGSTVKKGYEGFHAFIANSRQDKDWSDSLIMPKVIASVNNIVASSYQNAMDAMVRKNKFQWDEAVQIDKVFLARLAKDEVDSLDGIVEASVLLEQKKLVEDFISLFSNQEQKRLVQYTRKRENQWLRIKAYAQTNFFKMIASENFWVKAFGIWCIEIFSKHSLVIHTLDDIR